MRRQPLLEMLMINAFMLMIAVLPKMLRAKMAASWASEAGSLDRPDAGFDDEIDFIRNTDCPIPATGGLPTGG